MRKNSKKILIIICLILTSMLLLRSKPGIEKEINNIKVEIKSNADYVEFIDDELYIYLSVNFDFDKFKIEVLVDGIKVSNYPLLKMIQEIDEFIPQEYTKTLDLGSHNQIVHIIVR